MFTHSPRVGGLLFASGAITVLGFAVASCSASSPLPPVVQCTGDDLCSAGQYCEDGICKASCSADTDCDSGRCVDGRCLAQCTKASECANPPPCQLAAGATCSNGRCSYPSAPAQPCDDGDPCTRDDACATGTCQGSALADGQPCVGATGTCQGGQCRPACTGTGSCDDGDPCTHGDVCTAGTCAGTAITCESGPPPCGIQRSCNGTSACTESTPSAGIACVDGDACTYDDQCDGAGSCRGTTITCTSSACSTRQCNGTSVCAVTHNPGASCNDSNACTHTDRCDMAGNCAGTSYGCFDGNGCTEDICLGDGTCDHPARDGSCGNGGCCVGSSCRTPCP